MAIQDFGKKIGGARKDLWASRGLILSDIEGFNKAERDRYIKKNNIWIKPDYEKMLNEEGYSRNAIYFIKHVRDAIPTGPELKLTDTEDVIREKQESYIDFINELKEDMMKIKTNEDIDKISANYFINKGYVEKHGYFYDITPKSESFMTNKLFKAIQMSSTQANREATRKDFLGNQEKAIQEQFTVIEINSQNVQFGVDTLNPDKVIIEQNVPGGKRFLYPNHSSLDDKSLYKEGSVLVTQQHRILFVGTKEQANEFIEKAAKKIEEQKREDKETKKVEAKERKQTLKPPILDHINRSGMSVRNKNVEGQDFLQVFKIKGGEFGNWLNETERQANMNFAYESFKDLAKALNINDEDISLGGKLNIAFGSRGVKGAAAHYEPLREVINLTKMHGAGSLAHEYFHAMDDISGKELGVNGFATEHPRLRNSFTELIKALKYKEITVTSEVQDKELQERLNTAIQKFTDDIIKMVPDKTLTDEEKVERNRLLKELVDKTKVPDIRFMEYDFTKRNAKPKLSKDINDLSAFIDNHSKNYKMTPHNKQWLCGQLDNLAQIHTNLVQEKEVEKRRVETDFYKNAKELDKSYSKTTHGYWQSEVELAARAFACYIKDKLAEQDIKNDYLTGHAEQVALGSELKRLPVYPSKEERKVMNQAFDKVIQEMKELGIVHDRVDRELAVSVDDKYITIQETDKGFDYSIFDKSYNLLDGGIIENINSPIREVLEEIKSNNFNTISEMKEVSYEEITDLVEENERRKLIEERQKQFSDEPIFEAKECKQMSLFDLMNEAKEQKEKMDKVETIEERIAQKQAEIEALREEKAPYLKERALIEEERRLQSSLRKQKREELGMGPFEFAKSDVYKEMKAQEASLDNKWNAVNDTINSYAEKIDRLQDEIQDILDNKNIDKYEKDLKDSGLSEPDFRRQEILESMGTTTEPKLGGYVFPDGSMIKMGNGSRDDDHRFVRSFYNPSSREFNNQEEAMWSFISEGNIRWMPEGYGISVDINNPITRDQKMTLYDLVDYTEKAGRTFYMDIANNGKVIQSFQYEGKQMNVQKIMKDFTSCREQLVQNADNKENQSKTPTKKKSRDDYER